MNDKNKSLFKAIGPWVAVLILLSLLVPLLSPGRSTDVNYNEFMSIVEKEKVTEMQITPSVYVTTIEGVYETKEKGKDVQVSFETNIPNTDEETNSLMQLLEDKGIKVTVLDLQKENMVMNTILNLIPYVILIGGMIFMFKMIGGGGGGANAKAFDFGNSRAKLEKDSKTRFSDVAGADEEKEELKELV